MTVCKTEDKVPNSKLLLDQLWRIC